MPLTSRRSCTIVHMQCAASQFEGANCGYATTSNIVQGALRTLLLKENNRKTVCAHCYAS